MTNVTTPNGDIYLHELTPYLKNSVSPARFFEVALLCEPYYNPANLEKASIRVKQKEFIQSIAKAPVAVLAAHQRGRAPREYFFFRAARLGTAWLGDSATHQEPLSPVFRSRRALAAARVVSAAGSRPESRGHRARAEASRRRRSPRRGRFSSRSALSPLAHAPRTLPRASG